MPPPPTSPAPPPLSARCAFAVVATLAATWGAAVLDVAFAAPGLLLYGGAIAFSAAYGGPVPGLLSAGLSLLLSNVLFLPPRLSLRSEESLLPLLGAYVSAVVVVEIVRLGRQREPD